MVDGNTPDGGRPVILTLTEDETRQLIRSMEWAKMMDSHEDKPPHPQRLDVMAHRAFLEQILDKLHQEIDVQLQ